VVLRALLPWEFSPAVLALSAAVLIVYCRGWRKVGSAAGLARPAAFIAAVALPYAFLETHLEYLALHLFWLQRIDHLVLHHLAPFLFAISAPGPMLARGTPAWIRTRLLRPVAANAGCRLLYRILQQPLVASILFVGLIFFWLTPRMQLYSMLSRSVYGVMNATMLIDGILFWWLMLGPEDPGRMTHLSYGTRMAVLVAITIPQSVLGAYLTFHGSVLYPSFSICGRATSISPLVDQQIAGLNTWIPPGMMSAVGLAVIASRWLAGESAAAITSRAPPGPALSDRQAASHRDPAESSTGTDTPPLAPSAAGIGTT
jgi:putative membrane protein